MEAGEDAGLRLGVEIHQRVAADEQVEARDRRVLDEVVSPEDDGATQVTANEVLAASIAVEKFLPQLVRHLRDHLRRIRAAPRLRESLAVDVGSVDLDPVPIGLIAQRVGEQHRHRIGFLAGSATDAAHADRLACPLRADDLRNHALRQGFPGGGIAEEAGDVDEDRVEQRREFLGMDFEVVQISAVGLDVRQLAHPLLHAPHQARSLVAREIEAAAGLEMLEQRFELGTLFLDNHYSTSPPLITSVTKAAGISASGSVKSTDPAWIAALGMPKNSALALSCAMTVPPIFLIACTPITPSLPVPVNTTAIARSRWLAATDSNNRSAEGRTKCTSSVCVSDSVPSALTKRWRSGLAM